MQSTRSKKYTVCNLYNIVISEYRLRHEVLQIKILFYILDLSERLESGLSFLSTRREASKNKERRKIQLFVYFKNSGTSSPPTHNPFHVVLDCTKSYELRLYARLQVHNVNRRLIFIEW